MSTWNPNDKSTQITLSSGNTIATESVNVAQVGVRTTTAQRAGRYYAEFKTINVPTGGFGPGFASSGFSFTDPNGIGGTATSLGVAVTGGQVFVNNAIIGTAAFSAVAGTVYCMAVDFANNTFWWRVGAGIWNNSGTANPDTNTGGFTMTGLTAGLNFFGCFCTGTTTSDSCQWNGGGSAFANTPPTKFAPWDYVFIGQGFSLLPASAAEVVSY